jgi:hypothetical protein
MLWTDAYFINTADLTSVDPEVSDVASANQEVIVIDGATGIVQRAIESAGQELIAQMQRFGGYLSSGLVSANHLAAVFNVGGPGVNRTRVLLSQIVAYDPYFPLVKTWMTYKTLEKFYHAAFSRTLNDRYEKKMRQYSLDVRMEHWPNLKNIGLPVVYRPMPAPGAVNERIPGLTLLQSALWSASNVSQAVRAGTTGGVFDVAVTWVDQSFYLNPSVKANAEGYHSAAQTITVTAGNSVTVNIASLRPPTTSSDPASLSQAITTSLNASGWNVYVGATGGTLWLQNAQPIPIATQSYQLAADPVLSGNPADFGQYADAYFTMQDILQRG